MGDIKLDFEVWPEFLEGVGSEAVDGFEVRPVLKRPFFIPMVDNTLSEGIADSRQKAQVVLCRFIKVKGNSKCNLFSGLHVRYQYGWVSGGVSKVQGYTGLKFVAGGMGRKRC